MSDTPQRGQWNSRIGFIMAAAGSAIGLGNIVFFGANAYKYGAGAFYLPYLIALFVVGIPVMILELGLGGMTRRALPASLHYLEGKFGEFWGWFSLASAFLVTMYYIALLSWVFGMLLGAFGPLWEPSQTLSGFGGIEQLPNPTGYFFHMISGWSPMFFVVLIWAINLLIIVRGVSQIEFINRIFLPLMWLFILFLIVRGITLPHGLEGVYLLFTPDFSAMKDIEIWKGAFSQIFFTLSLGFGVMTAYASYLPKDADQVSNSFIISLMNCCFEFLAGIAIFTMLFSFSIIPKASSLSMSFFVIPQGIANMPGGPLVVKGFGIMFFILLLLAGISSSVSLVEAPISALIDKFKVPRRKIIPFVGLVGILGSAAFALPTVIDPNLSATGTLGLTLLDLIDHWAFSYGLLIGGLTECILLGWFFGPEKLRAHINQHSRMRLPAIFDGLIKYIIPAILIFILTSSALQEFKVFYGSDYPIGQWANFLPALCFLVWALGGVALSLLLTLKGNYDEEVQI
jgi:neurotransmitter:Na+ symporter, NSS family